MADGDAPLAKRPPLTMILKLVATVVILALVVYSLDLEKLSGALSAIDWHWLLLGSLASALFVSLRIIKWRELTRRNGMNASGKEIARTALLGLERFPNGLNREGFPNRQRSDSSCMLVKEASMHGQSPFG